jgi:hypothetical protein
MTYLLIHNDDDDDDDGLVAMQALTLAHCVAMPRTMPRASVFVCIFLSCVLELAV